MPSHRSRALDRRKIRGPGREDQRRRDCRRCEGRIGLGGGRLSATLLAYLTIGSAEELDDRQPMRAGGLGGTQVGVREAARFGRKRLIKLAGALPFAVDLVV